MKKRFWNGLNKESNIFGFGCWQIAGNHSQNGIPNGWGNVNENQAIDLLCYAMDNGIDFYDTAQGYNFGKSEQLLGKAIKETKKEVIVCTKIALTDKELNENKIGTDFKARVYKSVENVNANYIDIILIHNPPDDLLWQEFHYEVLQELIDEKIIGTYGVSSRGLKGAVSAIENRVGTTVEWVLNLFERRPITHLFPLISSGKINFIARSPLSRGLIHPLYLNTHPVFDANDFRSTLPKDWIDWVTSALRNYHSEIPAGTDVIKNALLFCSQFKEVNATILGIKTKKQLDHYLDISRSYNVSFDMDQLMHTPAFYPKWA